MSNRTARPDRRRSNPHTEWQLANDVHAGDAREAAMIRAANDIEAPRPCGACGREAWYKHTIGTHRCPVGHLRLGRDWS